MSEANKAIVRRLVEEVWSNGDLDLLDEIIHPEAHPPHGPWASGKGPNGFKQLVFAFRASFPDLKRTVEDMVAEGDTVILRYTITGTHKGQGDIAKFPPTGEKCRISGVTAFRFVDGRIFEEPWAFNDVAEMMAQLAKATVRRFIDEALNKGNLDVVDEVFAPDAVSHTPAGELQGVKQIKEPIIMRRTAFPNLKVTIADQTAHGDRIVTRITLSGTHKGDYRGVAATGNRASWSQIAIARFENGKIVESWRIPDRQGLREQLGAT